MDIAITDTAVRVSRITLTRTNTTVNLSIALSGLEIGAIEDIGSDYEIVPAEPRFANFESDSENGSVVDEESTNMAAAADTTDSEEGDAGNAESKFNDETIDFIVDTETEEPGGVDADLLDTIKKSSYC